MDKSIPKDDTSLTSFWSSILSFANHYQLVDTHRLASNYLLIYNSNGFAPLIKVVGQAELGKLHFWPNVQFGLEKARNHLPKKARKRPNVPRRPLRCTPRARGNASTGDTCSGRVHHAQNTSTLLSASSTPQMWMPDRPLSPHSPSLALVALACLVPRYGRPWPWMVDR